MTAGQAGFQESFRKWGELCSCHGVPDVFQSRTIIGKVFWIVITVFSFVQIIFQIRVFLADYMDPTADWIVNVNTRHEPGGMDYPNITICNTVRVNGSSMREYEGDRLSQGFVQFTFQAWQTPKKPSYDLLLNISVGRYTQWTRDNPNTTLTDLEATIRRLSMVNCEGTFVRCLHRGLDEQFPCCPSVEIAVSGSEICQTLVPDKGNPLIRQRRSGVKEGLEIVLDPGIRHSNEAQYANPPTGLSLHFNYAENDVFETDDPILVAPGTRNFISMKKVVHTVQREIGVYSRIQNLQPNCEADNGKMVILRGNYSQMGCYVDCDYQFLYEECNCTLMGPIKDHVEVCSPMEAYECLLQYQKRINLQQNPWKTGTKTQAAQRCSDQCLPACEYSEIAAKVSSNRIGHSRLQALKHNLQRTVPEYKLNAWNDSELNDLIVLEIFFSTTSSEVLETKLRFTIDELISQIGGSMGVWAGVSVLTLVQFLVYCLNWIIDGFALPLQQRQQQHKSRRTAPSTSPIPEKNVIYGSFAPGYS